MFTSHIRVVIAPQAGRAAKFVNQQLTDGANVHRLMAALIRLALALCAGGSSLVAARHLASFGQLTDVRPLVVPPSLDWWV